MLYQLKNSRDEPVDKRNNKPLRAILYTGEETEQKTITVPSVIGLSAQQANRTILNAGLNIRLLGTEVAETGAKVSHQHPAEGEQVAEGTVVTVMFEGYTPTAAEAAAYLPEEEDIPQRSDTHTTETGLEIPLELLQ